MVRAGCRLAFFGMESGTQRVLNLYKKKTTPRQNRLAAAHARAAGVDIIVGSFILGGPGETFREMRITTDFAKHCDIDFAQFNILGLSPGAPLWDEAIAKGYLDPEVYWESGVLAANVFPDSPPLTRIRDIARDAFMDFSLRPRYLVKELFLTLSSPFRIKAILSSVSSLPHWVNLRRLYKFVVPPTDEASRPS
jgi:anaerobic magnesium-protoporphyrin IX monomethyl ester cyclase